MLNDTLFLIRAREFDSLAQILAKRLLRIGKVDVVAVVDERESVSDTTPFAKVSLSEEALSGIGLTGLPENWGWFCGDMCYYLAASRYPGYRYYTLIESDVYLPEAGVKPLLSALEGCEADAIAAQLGPTPEPKKYSKGLAALGLDPAWGCIFPLSRVSNMLLGEMQKLRSEALIKTPGAILNDEGVLAGAVQRVGSSNTRLEDLLPILASRETFDTNPPHLFEAISINSFEERLYHPVVTFETVVKRLRTGEKNYTRHRMRKILRAAPAPMKEQLERALAEKERDA